MAWRCRDGAGADRRRPLGVRAGPRARSRACGRHGGRPGPQAGRREDPDQDPLDLVLLDLTLPDGDGPLRLALSDLGDKLLPFPSGSAGDDVDEAASKAGADAAISKEMLLPNIIAVLR